MSLTCFRTVFWLLGLAGVCTAQVATTTTGTTCGNFTGTAAAPVVSILHFGCVQGNISHYNDSVYTFKNISYALASGEYRWKHPGHVSPWSYLKDTTAFGPACPQEGVDNYDEECLTLNIWTPGNATFNDVYASGVGASPNDTASKYPVYVFFHGGRFGGGAASDPLYDGAGLAAKGVVVVTVQYRLGALGWLAHPGLSNTSSSGTSGNYGLVDQQASLHWTNENIASFGGDPSRITIGGQSTGAASVIDHIGSTLAAGLFEQVIAESGARYPSDPMIGGLAQSYRQLSTAEQQGVNYLETVLNVTTIDQARNLSVEAFLSSAQMNDETAYAGTVFSNNSIYMGPPLFRPVLDGYVLAGTYDELLHTGNHSLVSVLTGNNKDESGASPNPGFSVANYTSINSLDFGNLSSEYFSLYPAGDSSASANNASNSFYRDQSRIGTHLWANDYAAGCQAFTGNSTCSVYTYYWTHAPPGQDRGAYHMSEINYAFDNLYATDLPWTAEDYEISEKLSSYWVNFIANGDPNGDGLATWPVNEVQNAETMELGDAWEVIPVSNNTESIVFMQEWFSQWPTY